MPKKEELPVRVTGSNGIAIGFRNRKNAETWVNLKKQYHKALGETPVMYLIVEEKVEGRRN